MRTNHTSNNINANNTAFRVGREILPTDISDELGAAYVAEVSAEHRKSHGLYLTPVEVAAFMATQLPATQPEMRLLDPAAGAGVLLCAASKNLSDGECRALIKAQFATKNLPNPELACNLSDTLDQGCVVCY